MEDSKVKTILTWELQMTKQLLGDNYIRKEFVIQSRASVLRALTKSTDVFMQSLNVWP